MRIAILDPAAGLAGDMVLGALVDLGLEREWLAELPAALGVDGGSCTVEKVDRAGIAAVKVTWRLHGVAETPETPHGHDGEGHGMPLGALVARVERAPVSARVRERAVRALHLIGEAEARVHDVPRDRVRLHEVGAADALLDIVGAIGGCERLGIDAVYHLPVAVGTGWVAAAHGQLPVPAPATALLLEGVEVAPNGPVTGEATTPTGAALLRVLSDGAPPGNWRLVTAGWGAGTRNPAAWPNALRVILAEAAAEAARMIVVSADVDDLSPEYVEPARQAVLAAGAVECFTWAMQGKKGRLSFRLEALAPPERADAVTQALLTHSSTAGVRQITTSRTTLARRQETVELAGGDRVRVKVWDAPHGTRVKAEFDDVAAAAARLGRAAFEVAREVERRAREALGLDVET